MAITSQDLVRKICCGGTCICSRHPVAKKRATMQQSLPFQLSIVCVFVPSLSRQMTFNLGLKTSETNKTRTFC